MTFKEQYDTNKKKLLNSKAICKPNRDLFNKFLKYQEYKLKRINGFPALDEPSYKTLLGYLLKLNNSNTWFNNKDWTKLTKKDIKKVYDDLEDGLIKNRKGEPLKDKYSYYIKIFKSKPFEMAGKKELAQEVMEFTHNKINSEVRFFPEETFRNIIEVVNQPKQKLVCWLAWDIGENISTILNFQKKDFVKQNNSDTKEPEYLVKLTKDKLKRSRTARSELTNYNETVKYLDFILKDLEDNDYLFGFGHRQALKFLDRAVKITGSKCVEGQKVTWKDFRSSMACHLLKCDWTCDEIKSRLGHKPSSRVLDKYVNYFALNKHQPKKKIYDNDIEKLKESVEQIRERERLLLTRNKKLEQSDKFLKSLMECPKVIEMLNEDKIQKALGEAI